jgi:hypothetical protein
MALVEKRELPATYGPRLSGIQQKIMVGLWLAITTTSVISLALSIYSLNLWDRLPAAELRAYFPEMFSGGWDHDAYHDAVQEAGFSLSGYALIFTMARLIAGTSLLLVSFLLIRRYSDHLMAVLIAILLSIFAAAGIWGNLLFDWAVSMAPWMSFPTQLLGWLLWCGTIVIYTFPNGRFTPRWTLWLALLLVPLTFFIAFGVDIFLNPDNWPEPFYLLPNVVFIGGALFAVLYRYMRLPSDGQKRALRWYVIGIALLAGFYLIDLLFMYGYFFTTGDFPIQTMRDIVMYVLVKEPVWFALETLLAFGIARSVFREKLLGAE